MKQLHELIKKLEAILADENEILRVVKEELLTMKKSMAMSGAVRSLITN